MNPNIFRAYDIRGIADTDLNDDTVDRIGKAYGTRMLEGGSSIVCVGRDVRLSSERISGALIRGILSTGLDVVDIGMAPTPVLYFSIFEHKTQGGVMVTGSHNPIEFNGLKLNAFDGSVISLHGEDIQDLRKRIESGAFRKGSGKTVKKEIIPAYKKMLMEKIHLQRSFRIVIDSGNGTAGPIAPEVFERMGCIVEKLFCEPDGHFPNHLPDPTVMKNIVDLRKKVLSTHADMGLGYDGDADRVGLVDDLGRVVFADQILALLARDVLSRNPGEKIVFDVKCSQLLPEEIERLGGKPIMWKTGHSLLKAKMKEVHAPLAGEMSGHIFFKDGYFGYDDGIYVSFRLVQYLSEQKKKLSDLVDELPRFISTPEIRIDCPDEHKFIVVEKLVQSFKKDYQVVDVDGAQVLFGDGWGLVRASNTQGLLVLRFEAKTEKRLSEIREIFRKKLSEYPMVNLKQLDEN